MDLRNTDPFIVDRRVRRSMEAADRLFQKYPMGPFRRVFAAIDGPKWIESSRDLPAHLFEAAQALGFRKIGVLKSGFGPVTVEYVDTSGLLKLQCYVESGNWWVSAYTEDGVSHKSGPTASGNAKTNLLRTPVLEVAVQNVEQMVRTYCEAHNVAPLYRHDQASIVKMWRIFHHISLPTAFAILLASPVYVLGFAAMFVMIAMLRVIYGF